MPEQIDPEEHYEGERVNRWAIVALIVFMVLYITYGILALRNGWPIPGAGHQGFIHPQPGTTTTSP